jgi:hypothetical protein
VIRTIEDLERLRTNICRYPHHDRPADYQRLHHELKTAHVTGNYNDDDRRKIQALLDDVENRMKPKRGFLGGTTIG